MTVIELPDQQAAALTAKAAAQGLTLQAWLEKLAEEEKSSAINAAQEAAARIREIQSRSQPDPEGLTVRNYLDYGRR